MTVPTFCHSPLGVKDALLLVDLGEDRDSRVDGVRDDTDVSLGAVLGTGGSQVSDDRGVGVLSMSKGFTCFV